MNKLPKVWTEEEINILIEYYPKLGLSETAKLLDISTNRVKGKVDKLRLKTFARKLSTWTLMEESFLVNNYKEYGISKCAEIMKKSKSAIRSKLSRLGLTENLQWTPEQDKFLLLNYETEGPDFCAKELNKSKSAVIQQAHRKKLKTNKLYTKYSAISLEWLNNFNNTNILHAENGGEQLIAGYTVDGYDPVNNIVYEFHGDVFHGNLDIFKPNEYCHPFDKRYNAEELWEKTYNRMDKIAEVCTVIFIWENDYRNGRQAERLQKR